MTSMPYRLPLLLAVSLAGCQPSASDTTQATPTAAEPSAPAKDVANPAPPPVAEDALTDEASLQPLLKPDDHVLAFKRHDLTDDGKDDAVAIVRHATADASGNTCELLVLQQANSQWSVSDRSPQVVDCLYNDMARNAKRLDDNLTLATGTIVYVNQQARSNVTYTLNYDTAKTAWYLAEASSTAPVENPQSGKMEVFRGTVRYPADIVWTPIMRIDPEQLQSAMDQHKAAVK